MVKLQPAASLLAVLSVTVPAMSAAEMSSAPSPGSTVVPVSIPDGNPTFIQDGNPTFIQDGNPTFIQDAGKAAGELNRYIETVESRVGDLAAQSIPVPVEWIDARALAVAIAGSEKVYDKTCEGHEEACSAFENALGSVYAQSLGHHLHVTAVSHGKERFDEKPVVSVDELGSVRFGMNLEPGGPVDEDAAWYPPKDDVPSVRLEVDFRRPTAGGPYTVRDYSLAGKSFTHSMRKRLEKIGADPAKAKPTSWASSESSWVSADGFFETDWFVHPKNGAALSEAMARLATENKPSVESWM